MLLESVRRERLCTLVELARVYRGFSRNELARALGRDATRLVPETANPKLDLLVGLSNALDWSIDDVVSYLNAPVDSSEEDSAVFDFDAVNEEAKAAHHAGEFRRVVSLAQQLQQIAGSPEQRAEACNREHGGWEGLGRYTKAIDAVREGLRQHPISAGMRMVLQSNLANDYYCLGDYTSARATAELLMRRFESHPAGTRRERSTQAFAHYVRGQTCRALCGSVVEDCDAVAQTAREDLERAIVLYEALASDTGAEHYRGVANTCKGGLLEVDVLLANRDPESAVNEVLGHLDGVIDVESCRLGDWLESWGWWCVFGGNIALRHMRGRPLQRSMAILTNKALEIANHLDNWALREKVFTMQYSLHETLVEATGIDLDFTVDSDDLRLIAGTMGRFPAFRGVGWRIFQTAKVVKAKERN